jgi:hypothetical protein
MRRKMEKSKMKQQKEKKEKNVRKRKSTRVFKYLIIKFKNKYS